jgi:hypothetical protein
VSGVEQQVDVASVAARELVQHPRRNGRLPQRRNLVGAFRVTARAELLRQARPLFGELLERDAVEIVDRRLDRRPTGIYVVFDLALAFGFGFGFALPRAERLRPWACSMLWRSASIRSGVSPASGCSARWIS